MKTLAELKAVEQQFIAEDRAKEEAAAEIRKTVKERWKKEVYPKIVQDIVENIPKKLEEILLKNKRLPNEYTYTIDAHDHGYETSEIVDDVIKKLRGQGYNVRREYRHGHDDGVPTEGVGPSDWEYYDLIFRI